MRPRSAAVLGSFSTLAMRGIVPSGLLVLLFSYLSKSDVVVLGEFTSEPIGLSKEAGVISYVADFRIAQLIKGGALGERRVGGTIKVNIVRFESEPEDRSPELNKGGKCVLFLRCNDPRPGPRYVTSDMWFGIQRPSPWMVRALSRLAKEASKEAR
jgi:hypothetical protein